MYEVVHILDDCDHYNARGDRCHELEAAARAQARLHNGLIHEERSHEGPCAIYVDVGTIETDARGKEVTVDA